MLENRKGQTVPGITFKTRQNNDWVDVTTDELFAGKRVAVFSLPGAFTPTCSASHVPRYNELAPVFKANGIDDILCVAVNDTFVMNAWQQDQEAYNIGFIPDGTGAFTRAMGMLVNKDELGFGDRSWRYSMVVNDGVVEQMFIEPEKPGDPFEVSDADTMLAYINPDAVKEQTASIFTRKGCGHCDRAKELLTQKGYTWEEVKLGENISERGMRTITGRTSTPQVYINGRHIGGADELTQAFAQGTL